MSNQKNAALLDAARDQQELLELDNQRLKADQQALMEQAVQARPRSVAMCRRGGGVCGGAAVACAGCGGGACGARRRRAIKALARIPGRTRSPCYLRRHTCSVCLSARANSPC